ncbi:phosphate-starvation-inducible PsiE family protein [Halohasta salina]|uniref:phosphate-starvation-inducible PsiE family protein n=1 Tax=Halohasta salina TaxID=2961621 RepID=UPI0020A3CD5A|nr:phosphate-starvation-inducible PsiE family protein [Halohasta salina]
MAIDPADFTTYSRDLLRWFVLTTTYFLLALFLIGLFDLGLGLYGLIVTGEYTDPVAVVSLIDTVLLLLIVLEVHRTLIAYAADDPVLPIVVSAAIIAVARQIISFRVDEFGSTENVLPAALGLALLLLGLVIVFIAVRWDTAKERESLSSLRE